jgi:demethylmenaquinone methyltransferase / 2-methoxy-6-polyprenyl-1,4-benzoquinol methylase
MNLSGTTPAGTTTEEQASRYVRGMFGRVAHRYDLLNHVLSLNIDKYWRARTVRIFAPILDRPHATVLDLACGTGDLALALRRRARATVLASDFCHPMLVRAREKQVPFLFEGDALSLPLRDNSLDLITVAFGFRNFTSYSRGLAELRRVLIPGGTLAILEFSTPPRRVVRSAYRFYSTRVLPRIGAAFSGARDAYEYLPESVRKFPDAPALASAMRACGYSEVRFSYLTFGIVALHTGVKPAG